MNFSASRDFRLNRARSQWGRCAAFALIVIGFALSVAACRKRTAPSSDVSCFQVRGRIESLDAARSRAVISHEAIPQYMDAMRMEFSIEPTEHLSALNAGDNIEFRLCIGPSGTWIDHLHPFTGESLSLPPDLASSGANPSASINAVTLPDIALVDQEGRPFHLRDLQDRFLIVDFIYTRCPLPDYCPRLSEKFAIAARALSAHSAAPHWQMLSVSLDPEHDTPAVLHQYGERYSANRSQWILATGDRGGILQLCRAVGLPVAAEGGTVAHLLKTLVVEPKLHVRKTFDGNGWAPTELVAEVVNAAKPAASALMP